MRGFKEFAKHVPQEKKNARVEIKKNKIWIAFELPKQHKKNKIWAAFEFPKTKELKCKCP